MPSVIGAVVVGGVVAAGLADAVAVGFALTRPASVFGAPEARLDVAVAVATPVGVPAPAGWIACPDPAAVDTGDLPLAETAPLCVVPTAAAAAAAGSAADEESGTPAAPVVPAVSPRPAEVPLGFTDEICEVCGTVVPHAVRHSSDVSEQAVKARFHVMTSGVTPCGCHA